MEAKKYDVIIVGGGIAGLTSAAFLAKAGKKVILLEKNSEFGGLVGSFESDGFRFEVGVRALESAGIILPMLENLGIKLEMVRSKVSVGIENQIINIEDIDSIKDYRNLLVNFYKNSENEIDDFIKSMRKIMKLVDVLYGIDNPLFKDIKNDRKFLFKTLLPWLPKFLFTIEKINKLNVPFEKYLQNLIKNPSLIDIISQHFFKGTPTFFALSYFSLYLDYFFPKGGVGKIIEAIISKIIEFNGELKSNTKIVEINTQEQIVVDENNETYTYENLIWAADLKTFYNFIDREKISEDVKSKYIDLKNKVLNGKGSESVFSLYLQTDLPLSYFAKIAHGHFFYTPLTNGLGEIHRAELKTMLESWEKVSKEDLSEWFDRFLKFNTFEISIPGLKDSSLVPEGKSGLIISFIIEYELFDKINQSGWLDDIRKEIEFKIIEILSNCIYSKLKENINKQFSFTPISIKNRIGSTDGAIVGWSFEENVPVINKIQRSDKSVVTPFENIFQAGQWAYSPAGVPMSILTGKLASDRVLKQKNRKGKKKL